MEPPKPHLNDDGTYRFVGDLKTAVGPVPFLTHSFPDILPRAKTIGLLAVPANEAVPSIQGHNVSDILAWKTLMHREGRKANQVWLSSIDMAELIQTHEGTWTFAHGEDPACFAGTIATADLQGKNVSGAVGDNPDVPNAPVELYASPEDLKTAFGKQIRDKFQTAKDDNSALVIFASGRCDASQTIHIDLDTHVSVSQQAILDFAGVGPEGSDIPIVLITPAVFSGGWLVNPHIGRKATISDGKALDLWAKHCGGFFMTWADDLLTTGDTCPLLTADEQKAAPSDLTPLKISLRPLKDEFRAEIQRLLQCQLSKFTTIHSFDTSDSSTDDWETYWSQRLGKSLADWKKKWADLPVVPSDAKCDGLPFLGHAFGGSKSSQVAHLKFLTKLELDTCTGDWDKKAYAETDGMLRDFMAETLPTEKQCKDLYDLLEFRASGINLADTLVRLLGYPLPQGQSCRDWDYDAHRLESLKQPFQAIFTDAWAGVLEFWSRVTPGMSRHDFFRPSFYVADAMAKKYIQIGADEKVEEFVDKNLKPAMAMLFDTQKKLLLDDVALCEIGNKFLSAVGAKIDPNAPKIEPEASLGLPVSIHNPRNRLVESLCAAPLVPSSPTATLQPKLDSGLATPETFFKETIFKGSKPSKVTDPKTTSQPASPRLPPHLFNNLARGKGTSEKEPETIQSEVVAKNNAEKKADEEDVAVKIAAEKLAADNKLAAEKPAAEKPANTAADKMAADKENQELAHCPATPQQGTDRHRPAEDNMTGQWQSRNILDSPIVNVQASSGRDIPTIRVQAPTPTPSVAGRNETTTGRGPAATQAVDGDILQSTGLTNLSEEALRKVFESLSSRFN